MRVARIAFGVVVLLLGSVFAGQGLGYIRGSVMTGAMQWFWIGLAMDVVALGLIFGPGLLRRDDRIR